MADEAHLVSTPPFLGGDRGEPRKTKLVWYLDNKL